jgi:hypothetical protein
VRRTILSLGLCGLAFAPGGCVFQQIHDQLVINRRTILETNRQLAGVNERLDEVDVRLGEVNDSLGDIKQELQQVKRTNDLLIELQAGLGAEGPNGRTKNRETIIGTMEAIAVALASMDLHLSSLRRTLENIDSTIPFLRFADSSEDAEPEIDPETGWVIDPATGHLINPETEALVHPETGEEVDPALAVPLEGYPKEPAAGDTDGSEPEEADGAAGDGSAP